MAINISNSKENILQYIDYKGITREKFFKKIGVSYGNFKGKAKSYALSSETLAIIITNYPDINPEWLITGKGPMLREEEHVEDSKNVVITGSKNFSNKGDNNINTGRIKTIHSAPNIQESPSNYNITKDIISVPIYDIEATAGVVTLFDDMTKGGNIGYISMPNIPKCDGACYVRGDSMYPILKSGDIVLYKQMHDIHNIIYGEMYLINCMVDGDFMILVKYLNKSEKEGHVKLVSYNKHHQDIDISFENIKDFAIIKVSIRKNIM